MRHGLHSSFGDSWRLRLALARKFVLGELLGRPRVVNLEVTKRCNARCDFCGYFKERRIVELRDYRPVLERFDPVVVNLTGGEPLLRPDLTRLVAQIKAFGSFYLSLLTNASLLSPARAAALRDAGLDGLSISLNHPDEAHDRERAIPGLFAHIRSIIPGLRALRFRRVDLNTVILPSNTHQLLTLTDLARQWGVGICFSCYSSHKAQNRAHEPRGSQREAIVAVVHELRRRKRAGWPIGSSDWYLSQIPRHLAGGVPACQAGRRTVHVTPDGLVKPCPDLPAVSHFSRYDPRAAPALDCTCCWYRCRGEVEAPLLRSQVFEYTRSWG